ncbi:MAG TPA: 3-keto-5-aminohexanoate cleavage protein [Acidimicrobiales bacterium]
MLLKACLNGGRQLDDHPRCPITPGELAADGAAALAAGAEALHVHPRNEEGYESLAPHDVGATVEAMREIVEAPIGVTTGAWIVPDPEERLRAVESWTVLPDFASVNFDEPGAAKLATALLERGVAVEAGLPGAGAAGALAASGLADRLVRILLELDDETIEAALATLDELERALAGVAPDAPRLLHGRGDTTWDLLGEAARREHDARIGIEDTVKLPDGSRAHDNAELVRTAVAHYRAAGLEAR